LKFTKIKLLEFLRNSNNLREECQTHLSQANVLMILLKFTIIKLFESHINSDNLKEKNVGLTCPKGAGVLILLKERKLELDRGGK
jgi:hypothetical protein